MQAKSKSKILPASTVVAVSSSVSTPSIPAIVTSAITTQALQVGQGLHSIQTASSSTNQQQQAHNVVAQHLPILMDPLVPSNYLISI